MYVVLLAGGVGTRLWPLSTGAHPKQLLRLLATSEQEKESLLERAVRLILSVNSDVHIVVSTSSQHKEQVMSQVHDRGIIHAEPSSRGTFPAIVSAAAFLHYEKHVPKEEIIIITPADTYADEAYYHSLSSLADCAKQCQARIMLMGIHSSYPSTQYGYIIPSSAETVSTVLAFKEKPDASTAKEYIKRGAMWNAGVCACSIGNLLEIVNKYVLFSDYKELVAQYHKLPNISFDSEVLEKETNLYVMRYEGVWNDLGSWESLSRVLPAGVYGRGVLPANSHNVHLFNNTNLPVICVGIDNITIAVSDAGVLIAAKDSLSGINLKEYEGLW